MSKPLRVFFHGSSLDNRDLLNMLERETCKAARNVTLVETVQDMIDNRRADDRSPVRYGSHVSGNDHRDLVTNIVKFNRRGEAPIIISLSDEMLAAAGEAQIPAITCGLPENFADDKLHVMKSPDALAYTLLKISLEKN